MLPVLSERLQTVAALVPGLPVLADVGTDHGYVPVLLCGQGKIRRAIAMDINRGPLERAEEHIRRYGLEDYIETRLSDGVAALDPGEADVILIAGMGGGLVLHILEEGAAVCRRAEALVLQPQSEIERVREYLLREGYVTDAEEIVLEDGKFYPMMRVHYGNEAGAADRAGNEGGVDGMAENDMCAAGAAESEVCVVGMAGNDAEHAPDIRKEPDRSGEDRLGLRYGALLLRQRHPVLLRYLERERRIHTGILTRLKAQKETEEIRERIREISDVLELNRLAGKMFADTE